MHEIEKEFRDRLNEFRDSRRLSSGRDIFRYLDPAGRKSHPAKKYKIR